MTFITPVGFLEVLDGLRGDAAVVAVDVDVQGFLQLPHVPHGITRTVHVKIRVIDRTGRRDTGRGELPQHRLTPTPTNKHMRAIRVRGQPQREPRTQVSAVVRETLVQVDALRDVRQGVLVCDHFIGGPADGLIRPVLHIPPDRLARLHLACAEDLRGDLRGRTHLTVRPIVVNEKPSGARVVLVNRLDVKPVARVIRPAQLDDDPADPCRLERFELIDREAAPAVLIPRNVEGQRAYAFGAETALMYSETMSSSPVSMLSLELLSITRWIRFTWYGLPMRTRSVVLSE